MQPNFYFAYSLAYVSETATYAFDFGQGGLSGIGPLTTRNLGGHGRGASIQTPHGIFFLSIYHLETPKWQQRTQFTLMAVPNGHVVHLPPTEKRPLILTHGHIRVRFFYATFEGKPILSAVCRL